MNATPTEDWLAALQARFTAVIRTPLVIREGAFAADVHACDAMACADVVSSQRHTATARLAVYQRQYWMRLFNVFQEQYFLTMRLLGAFTFNRYAGAFLQEQPPRTPDLLQSVRGFDSYLASGVPDGTGRAKPPWQAVIEAAQLDASFSQVFYAPKQSALGLRAAEAESLLHARLHRSLAVTCFEQHWPLLQLRQQVFGEPAEHALRLPAQLAAAETWVIFRTESGVAHALLDAESARLFTLLEELSLADALATLEAECDPGLRPGLPARTERFFAQAVKAGLFSGFS